MLLVISAILLQACSVVLLEVLGERSLIAGDSIYFELGELGYLLALLVV